MRPGFKLNAILLVFLLSACNYTYHYAEFIQPSEIYVPAKIYHIGVLNRAANAESVTPIIVDGVPYEYIKGLPEKAANRIISTLQKDVSHLGRFNLIPLEWDNSGLDNKNFLTDKLSEEEVKAICEENQLSGLITLDGLDLHIKTNGEVNVVNTTDDAGMPVRVPEFNQQQEVNLTLAWRMYSGETGKLLDDYQETYERYFNQVSYQAQTDEEVTPDRMALVDVAAVASYDYHNRISPHWKEGHRLYYKGNSNEMLAISQELEYNGKWDQAATGWKQLTLSDDEKTKFYALYNMAVASEMLGNPKLGKEWLLKAQAINDTKQVQRYMQILDQQIIMYEVVNRQLGIK